MTIQVQLLVVSLTAKDGLLFYESVFQIYYTLKISIYPLFWIGQLFFFRMWMIADCALCLPSNCEQYLSADFYMQNFHLLERIEEERRKQEFLNINGTKILLDLENNNAQRDNVKSLKTSVQ